MIICFTMETVKKNSFSDMIDKVSFVNYLPLLKRATADSNEPVPGYLFQEIENISRQPEPNCQLLVDYLTQRLDKPSAAIKMKVLKIMNHLILKGPRNFRQHLRNRDSSVKMATSYHEAPDPLTGTSAAETVRKLSQDLLLLLFDAQSIATDEALHPQHSIASNTPTLGGLGSSKVTSGKYEGFGSSPVHKEDNFADKMLNALEQWALSTDQTDLLIQDALSNSPGNYEPVAVDLQLPAPKVLIQSHKPQAKKRVHVPGKAGGGWDDEPNFFSSNFLEEDSVKSTNSSEQGAITNENTESEVSVSADINTSPEALLVQYFCSANNLSCTLTDIRSTGQRCTQLNVKEVVQVIVQILDTYLPDNDAASSSEIQLIRAMLLLEWLLRTDAVHLPTVAEMCCPSLSRIVSHGTPLSNCKPPPLQAKAEKLVLILQKLKSLPV